MRHFIKPVHRYTQALCLIAVLICFPGVSGCASDHYTFRPDASEVKRTASYSIPQTTSTSLGHALAGDVKANPGKSGFHVLEKGTSSLKARLALISAADKSIDLQYYAMHDDSTSNLLLEAILRAASRGVHVRFLLDYISLGDVGNSLSILDNNKNIEIRVFNPLVTRHQSVFSKLAGSFADLNAASRRMHNKMLISDNQMTILGGRNLGDEYFDANADTNFKDLDILTAGPITDKLSKSFDKYWNSDDSFPIAALRVPDRDPKKMELLRQGLKQHWDEELKTPDGKAMLESPLSERMKSNDINLTWASAELAVDDPSKIKQPDDKAMSKPLARLVPMADNANHEFVLVSPYFVPQDVGVKWLDEMVKRGIKVKVLTNSLASTDVVAVHTGYRRYRKQVVEGGIDLYELKPIEGKRPKQRLFGSSAPSYASLHSKVYVIDKKDTIIGSFNFDPRSIELNTELALVIHSPEIAQRVMKMFDESTTPQNSYHLIMYKKQLIWLTTENGKRIYYTNEPKAGIWRNTESFFMSMLPIESQL